MTEQRLAEAFEGLRALRDALVRAAGDLTEHGNAVADLALALDRMSLYELAKPAAEAADAMARIAREFGAGLERLTRLADSAMDDTRPMDMAEIAAISAEDKGG